MRIFLAILMALIVSDCSFHEGRREAQRVTRDACDTHGVLVLKGEVYICNKVPADQVQREVIDEQR